jgi:hypothetical protein
MEERCDECGFDASADDVLQVAAALEGAGSAVQEHVRALSAETVRHRPGPGIWSPVEYLGHLRESMAFHRWLIERALAEQSPRVPAVDPDDSVARAGYQDGDVEELLAQFERRVARLRQTVSALRDEEPSRAIVLDGRSVTVALVARSALHECRHPDGDILRASPR